MVLDPRDKTITAHEIFDDIEAGNLLNSVHSPAMQNQGSHVISLDLGVNDLMSDLADDFWTVSFLAYDEDELRGIFSGYCNAYPICPYAEVYYHLLEPSISWSPTSIDFGVMNAGDCTGDHNCVLENVGNSTSTGTINLEGNDPDQFIITSGSGDFELEPGETHLTTVKFCPNSVGNFDALLIAFGDDPCNNDTIPLHGQGIYGNIFIADFFADDTSIQKNESVQFYDISQGNPTSWNWIFEGGDPPNSNDQNPIVTFFSTEMFDVSLTVTNDTASDNETKMDYIHVYESLPDCIPLNEYLCVYYDNIDTVNGNFEVSGNVSINNILKFEGAVAVNPDSYKIGGNARVYIDNIPNLDSVSLYEGEFNFSVLNSLLSDEFLDASNQMFELANLPIELNRIRLMENGICLSGIIVFPEILGKTFIDIDSIEITRDEGINYAGSLNVDELKVYNNSFSLNDLYIYLSTYDSTFICDSASLKTPIFTLNPRLKIAKGRLSYIGLKVNSLNPGIPLGVTGLNITGIGAFVEGLDVPPLFLSISTDLSAPVNYIKLTDLNLSYAWKTSLRGGGNLDLFNSRVASASFTVSKELFDLAGEVTLSPSNKYFTGGLEACIYKENPLRFEGRLYASLQIPDFEGFPSGLIKTVVDIPFEVASTDNYLRNSSVMGNFHLLDWININYKFNWVDSNFKFKFGQGYKNWSSRLFDAQRLVLDPNSFKINNFEGQSLPVKDGIKEFDLLIPTNTLIIWLRNEITLPSASILLPDSALITPSNITQFPDIIYLENKSQLSLYFIFNNPELGHYQIFTDNGSGSLDIFGEEIPPVIELLPLIQTTDSTVLISWKDDDKDSDALIDLYFDKDNHGANGYPIASGISEDGVEDNFEWKIDSIETGDYYVYAIIYDTTFTPFISYSPSSIKIIDTKAPSTPESLVGSITEDTLINLSWQYDENDTITRFVIYYATESDEVNFNSNHFNIGVRNNFTFTTLIPGRTYHFAVTALDSEYHESDFSNIITLEYISNTLNNAPVIYHQSIPGIAYVGSQFEYQLLSNDPDGDQIEYSLICIYGSDTLTNELAIDDAGLINWSPDQDDIGRHLIKAKVTDPEGLSDSLTFVLTVLNPEFDKPYIGINAPVYTCFGGGCFISVEDPTLDTDPYKIDSIEIYVTSNADPIGKTIIAKETEPASKEFLGIAEFSILDPDENQIKVDSTDKVKAIYINPVIHDTVSDFCYFKNEPFEVQLDIIGNTSICVGEQIDITLDAGEYASYLWQDGKTKTRTLHITQPGNYYVTVSNAYGCIKTSDTISISLYPLPPFNLSENDILSVCSGYELNPGEMENCTYTWNDGDTNQVKKVFEPGWHYLTVTNEFGCDSTDGVFVAEVYQIPVVELGQDITICPYDSVILDAGEGSSYLWSTGETARFIKIGSTGIGFYAKPIWVQVYGEGDCMSNDTVNIVFDFAYCTGTKEFENQIDLKLFPNPNQGKFTLKIVNSLKGGQTMISINKLDGVQCFQDEFESHAGETFERIYNLSWLKDGIYILRYITSKKTLSYKLIISH
ncbi:MAG: fibronectin type III domain-containing protein [Bacteroidales bacterium]